MRVFIYLILESCRCFSWLHFDLNTIKYKKWAWAHGDWARSLVTESEGSEINIESRAVPNDHQVIFTPSQNGDRDFSKLHKYPCIKKCKVKNKHLMMPKQAISFFHPRIPEMNFHVNYPHQYQHFLADYFGPVQAKKKPRQWKCRL